MFGLLISGSFGCVLIDRQCVGDVVLDQLYGREDMALDVRIDTCSEVPLPAEFDDELAGLLMRDVDLGRPALAVLDEEIDDLAM